MKKVSAVSLCAVSRPESNRGGKLLAKVKDARVRKLKRLGRERALIYKTGILTGLRKGGLASIKRKQCFLNVKRPYITLDPNFEKNGEGNIISLRDDLAAELKAWVDDADDNDPESPLFYVPSGLLKIFNRDLVAAEIDKIDENGRSVDVHALRHSFGTLLSTSGVAPRIAQEAMRHSDMSLTMNVYTDAKQLDVHAAVNSLPVLNPENAIFDSQQKEGSTVSQVSMVSQIPQVPDETERTERVSPCDSEQRLVSPMVSPRTCPDETIQDNKGSFEGSDDKVETKEKPRENVVLPELLSVGLTGFEPATSTPQCSALPDYATARPPIIVSVFE